MNFNESITINTYSDNANRQFNEMQNRLSKIEGGFQTRMDGKTTGGLVGSLIGTLFWLAVFIACAIMAGKMVNGIVLAISLAVVLGLMAFMLIDVFMDFSYYGKIAAYKNDISQLQNRVSIGKNSIRSNYDAFMGSKVRGWNYLLNIGSSIPDEATSIEATMANMESLKKGFINGAKNVFFFASVVMVTIAGSLSLFSTGNAIITGISGESISSDTLTTLCAIAMIIVCVGEVILAKLAWSKTDCAVTNITLFIIALGPIAFLALIAIATLLVMLVIWLVGVVLAILAVVAVGAVIIGCLCGG